MAENLSVKLDVKDRKLLFYLSQNYRLPFSVLGRLVGLSKDSVKYRFNKLVDSGVLSGSTLIYDPLSLGGEVFEVFLRFHNLSPAIEKKIFDFLVSSPRTQRVLALNGSWDAFFLVIVRNVVEFDEVMFGIRERFFSYIKDFRFAIESKEYLFRMGIPGLLQGTEVKPLSQYKKSDSSFQKQLSSIPQIEFGHYRRESISKEDAEMLKALNSDLRANLNSLSSKLNWSKDKLKARIGNLIKRNLLQAFWPVISYERIGLHGYMLLIKLKRIPPEEDKALNKFFKSQPFIERAVRVIGEWDLYVLARASTPAQFYEIQKEFVERFSEIVLDYYSLMVREQKKYNIATAVEGFFG